MGILLRDRNSRKCQASQQLLATDLPKKKTKVTVMSKVIILQLLPVFPEHQCPNKREE